MWWKIYFWFFAFLVITGLIGYGTYTRWTARDFIDIATIIFGIIGLYAYVYKKQILSQEVWMWIFWIYVIESAVDIVYLYSGILPLPPYLLPTGIEETKPWYIPALLLGIPWMYALYQLGYTPISKQKKK